MRIVAVIPPWQKYLVQKLPCYVLVGEATPTEVEQNSLLKYTVYFTFIPLLAAKFGGKGLQRHALPKAVFRMGKAVYFSPSQGQVYPVFQFLPLMLR